PSPVQRQASRALCLVQQTTYCLRQTPATPVKADRCTGKFSRAIHHRAEVCHDDVRGTRFTSPLSLQCFGLRVLLRALASPRSRRRPVYIWSTVPPASCVGRQTQRLSIDQSEQGTPDRGLNARRYADLPNDIVDMEIDGSLAHVHEHRNICR